MYHAEQSPAQVGSQPREGIALPKLLTVREFYNAFDGAIGINTVYELVRAGRIRSVPLTSKSGSFP